MFDSRTTTTTGVEPMRDHRAVNAGARSPALPKRPYATRLLASSLLLYLLAVLADRLWLLLNSDVTQLLRRLH